MRIGVGDLTLEARPGVPTARLVEFARACGEDLPDRPWCGVTRLAPEHLTGEPPLIAFARLTCERGPDARPRPGAHLAVVGGPDAGVVATLAQGLIVGRGPSCGLRLNDPTVGAEHAVFDSGSVRDLGSPNGTSARGRRVRRRAAVARGDVIRLGGTTLVLATDAGLPVDATRESARTSPLTTGLAAGGAAGLSMAAFAIMTGHWPLAVVAVAIPIAGLAMRRLRRTRPSPAAPLLDVTGTLGLPALPPGPIAVTGPRGLVRAVTLAAGAPAASTRHWEPWMSVLPPASQEVSWLRPEEVPPSWVRVHVRGRGDEVTVTSAGVTSSGPLPLVSEAAAEASARRIAALRDDAALPASVRWSEIPAPTSGGLPVRLGLGLHGPVILDLVADGPHILVAGTTGSGKSEALRTIIGSLAHDMSPQHVTFALLDFKGGASLARCARLPHVGSLLTDLEPHLARRCLLALAAELADRKRAAAAAGASSFEDWPSGRPPRLVVVVDEFQEIAAADRDFLPELARLAAQGRSLGMHLVLATQRPAGAVGAAIRANIGATLALRTASDTESRDLIGTDAAARLPSATPGRAVLARDGEHEVVQVALPLADPPTAVRLASTAEVPGRDLCDPRVAHGGPQAPPLWLPPVPSVISLPPAAEDFTLGVVDDPRARRRVALTWDPAAGPLVIAGPPRSGRTATLGAVAAIAESLGMTPVWVPTESRLAVRTLALAAEVPRALLLVDDGQRTLAAATSADPEAAELLAAAMLRVPSALVVPSTWATHRLTASAGVRLVLTGLARHDDASWGIPQDLRDLEPRPGRARVGLPDGWYEAQVAWIGHGAPPPRRLALALPDSIEGPLPQGALGIGTDRAIPVIAPTGPAAVIGPAGPERDAVARRVAAAVGEDPFISDNAFALAAPGARAPRTIVCVAPTARSLREIARAAPRGLLEPTPRPFRAIAVIDGATIALQLLPG